MALSVYPIQSSLKINKFDLFESLKSDLENSHLKVQNGDIIVISSKYVANCQDRNIEYQNVQPSEEAKRVAIKFRIKPKIAEIILRESDVIFGGIPGFVITSSDYIMAPNAGIDKSNAKAGTIILYPTNPYRIAEELRRQFLLSYECHVGIIIVDSRLMPARTGTVGIAIACAGIEPVSDLRGKKDLYGNPLKVTFQAVADNLASIANLKMGEGNEAIPAALVRNAEVKLTDRRIREDEMAISYEQCVYVRGLGTRI